VETDGWLPCWQTLNLDLLPANSAHAKPQHLRDGLLCGPAPSHRLRATAYISALGVGQHTPLKPFWMATQDVRNASNANDVNADLRRVRGVLPYVHHSTVTDFARFFG
jgi:hypothetical protein